MISEKTQFMTKKRINMIAFSLAFLMIMIAIEPLFTSVLSFILIQILAPTWVIFLAQAIKEKSGENENFRIWGKYALDVFELLATTILKLSLIYIPIGLFILFLTENDFYLPNKSPIIFKMLSYGIAGMNLFLFSFFYFRFVLQKSVKMYREICNPPKSLG